jgi:hypothetical protein
MYSSRFIVQDLSCATFNYVLNFCKEKQNHTFSNVFSLLASSNIPENGATTPDAHNEKGCPNLRAAFLVYIIIRLVSVPLKNIFQ